MIVVAATQTSGGRGRKAPPSLQREGTGSGAEVGGVAGGTVGASPPTYPSLKKFWPSGLRNTALSLTQPTSMDAAAKSNPAVETRIPPLPSMAFPQPDPISRTTFKPLHA